MFVRFSVKDHFYVIKYIVFKEWKSEKLCSGKSIGDFCCNRSMGYRVQWKKYLIFTVLRVHYRQYWVQFLVHILMATLSY
jgi:hypothetical protein